MFSSLPGNYVCLVPSRNRYMVLISLEDCMCLIIQVFELSCMVSDWNIIAISVPSTSRTVKSIMRRKGRKRRKKIPNVPYDAQTTVLYS